MACKVHHLAEMRPKVKFPKSMVSRRRRRVSWTSVLEASLWPSLVVAIVCLAPGQLMTKTLLADDHFMHHGDALSNNSSAPDLSPIRPPPPHRLPSNGTLPITTSMIDERGRPYVGVPMNDDTSNDYEPAGLPCFTGGGVVMSDPLCYPFVGRCAHVPAAFNVLTQQAACSVDRVKDPCDRGEINCSDECSALSQIGSCDHNNECMCKTHEERVPIIELWGVRYASLLCSHRVPGMEEDRRFCHFACPNGEHGECNEDEECECPILRERERDSLHSHGDTAVRTYSMFMANMFYPVTNDLCDFDGLQKQTLTSACDRACQEEDEDDNGYGKCYNVLNAGTQVYDPSCEYCLCSKYNINTRNNVYFVPELKKFLRKRHSKKNFLKRGFSRLRDSDPCVSTDDKDAAAKEKCHEMCPQGTNGHCLEFFDKYDPDKSDLPKGCFCQLGGARRYWILPIAWELFDGRRSNKESNHWTRFLRKLS